MKYKVGDKVKIKSLEWYNNSQKDEYGSVKHGSGSNVFTNNMTKYAGMEATISKVGTYYYTIEIDGGMWGWNDWMFDESFSDKGENQTAYDYEQLKEIAIDLIRAEVNPRTVVFLAKEIYKELKTK